jgi:hypothetical protein
VGFVTWRRLLGSWDLVEYGWFHGGECRSGWGYAGWCSVVLEKIDVRMKRIL